MAARGLTVTQLVRMAGVSRSAMEKYLAGPSSPGAVTIANLSKELNMSADLLMFGNLDPQVESAYQRAFKAFADLIEALECDPIPAPEFRSLKVGSKAFADFARDQAFARAGLFKRSFEAGRRDEHFRIV